MQHMSFWFPVLWNFALQVGYTQVFQTSCYQPPNGVEPLSEILQIWSDGLFGGFLYVHVCVWLMERGPIGWHCRMELEFIEAQPHLEHGLCR